MATATTVKPLSWLEVLKFCAAIQQWQCLPPTKDGRPYGASYFTNRAADWMTVLQNPSRKVAKKLIKATACSAPACETPLSENSTGDHIIPQRDDGTNSIENYAPMCKQHNSQKSAQDLLMWWASQNWPLAAMDRNLLCSYARLTYKHYTKTLSAIAPRSVRRLIHDYIKDELPSAQHSGNLIVSIRRYA